MFCDLLVYSSPLSQLEAMEPVVHSYAFSRTRGRGSLQLVVAVSLFVNLFSIGSICRFSLRFFVVLQSIFVFFFNHKLMLYQSNGCDPLICSSCCADTQPQNCFHCYVITAILQLLWIIMQLSVFADGLGDLCEEVVWPLRESQPTGWEPLH